MKKIIVLLLFLSLLLGSFASCGNAEGNNTFGDGQGTDNSGNENSGSGDGSADDILDMFLSVLPGAEDFSDIYFIGDDNPYGISESVRSVYKSSGGYVVIVETKGYNDGLAVMCGLDNDGKIVGVRIFAHNESQERMDKVLAEVEGKDGAYAGMDYITIGATLVSGATMTSKGVAEALNIATETVCKLLEKCATVDFIKDSLAEYIDIDESFYKGYTVVIDEGRVSLFDVENAILKVLCKNKITPEGDLIPKYDVTLSAGDVANIYHRGYTIGEDGEKNYFVGGCNFSDTPTSLELGSGAFIPGFEYNLIGKNQKDYATLTKIEEGDISSADIISIGYSYSCSDGTVKTNQSAMIDLKDQGLDLVFGEGFSRYFSDNKSNITVGQKFATGSDTFDTVKTGENGELLTYTYFDVTVGGAYDISEAAVLVIETYFPEEYHEPSLSGKTAYFEVYIKSVIDYITPELNDEFITSTLKLSAAFLEPYEGETLLEKYHSYVREQYITDNGLDEESLIADAFWKSVMDGAVIKRYPEGQLKSMYNNILSSADEYYYSNSYYQYIYSHDDFMCLYLGVQTGSDWRSEIVAIAKEQLKQQLVFYRIMNKEGIKPSEEEYQALFNEYLEQALESVGITRDDFDSAAQYEVAKNQYKDQIIKSYGEDYFRLMIYYNETMAAILSYANIVRK